MTDLILTDSPEAASGRPPLEGAQPVDGPSPIHGYHVSRSPAGRAWLRFMRNRLGFWSLVAFCTLVVLSLGAELISNDRPLIVRYEGQTYFPMVKEYPEKTFGGDFETALIT